jgi:ketosteroid isomerase-like protein
MSHALSTRSLPGPAALRAVAFGAFALGATAVGALAIGALAIGRLSVRSARIARLEIGEFAVRRVDHRSSAAEADPDEAAIRGAIEDWTRAVRAKDLEAVMRHYAPEFRAFDIAPPLQSRDLDAWRSGMRMWFESWSGPVGLDMHDLEIEVDGDVAYSTSVNHIAGARADGEATDMWLRATVGWRRTGGAWLVAHEHVSVPLYMDGSNRAAVDLRP